MNGFVKERHEAFVEAVLNNNFDKVKAYAKKYGVPIPRSKKIMKASVYKAVQCCTDIPEKIKTMAMQKCLELGFNPFIDWGE